MLRMRADVSLIPRVPLSILQPGYSAPRCLVVRWRLVSFAVNAWFPWFIVYQEVIPLAVFITVYSIQSQ